MHGWETFIKSPVDTRNTVAFWCSDGGDLNIDQSQGIGIEDISFFVSKKAAQNFSDAMKQEHTQRKRLSILRLWFILLKTY